MLERAYSMFASRAYVHQYAAHGISADYLESAFARIVDLNAAYGALCGPAAEKGGSAGAAGRPMANR